MTDHQILFAVCCVAILFIFVIVIYGETIMLSDQLTMARHTIAELAPKAKAWDEAHRDFGAYQAGPVTARAAAAVEGEHRVQYAHLSAECDGCDEPAPRDMGSMFRGHHDLVPPHSPRPKR